MRAQIRLTTRLLPLILLAGCADSKALPPEAAAIDQYINTLPYLPVDEPSVVMGGTSAAQRDGEYSCTTENLKETRQFDRIVAYAANSDSLWPGALVSADSVTTGLFTQVVLPRAPSTFSVSLENLGGTKKATLPDPSLSTFRDALSGILDAEITGSTPANIYSEIEEVHSEEQLNMALDVKASWALGVASLKTAFNFMNNQVRSRYVVKYTQAYYTVDLDAPQSPSAMFSPDVTLADVQAKMDETHPPAYVTSVTYGRMVLFTFESQYSSTELGAALNFAYSGGVDIKGDVSVTYKDIISQSKITAFILGGDAGSAVQTIDSYDKLMDFIKDGGNYSKQSPGAPIAYKLAYLQDNSPARMSMTTDYDVKDCVRVAQKIKVTLDSITCVACSDAIDSTLEVYGLISAQGTDIQTLWTKTSSNYASINNGQTYGSTAAPLGEAVLEVNPQPGNTINLSAHLFDHDPFSDDDLGNETVQAAYETGWRRAVTVHLTGSGNKLDVNLTLEPI